MTRFDACWVGLFVIGIAILAFGVIVVIFPEDPERYSRAIGAASIGMGLFGAGIALVPFRRRDRWAWLALWYYPLFWAAHLLGDLPPGKDHVHQVVFIVMSLAALLFSAREFFSAREAHA